MKERDHVAGLLWGDVDAAQAFADGSVIVFVANRAGLLNAKEANNRL